MKKGKKKAAAFPHADDNFDVDRDWDFADWFLCLTENNWADDGQPLTDEELMHEIKTGKMERPIEISLRVPQGIAKFVVPAGRSIFEVDGIAEAMYKAIGRKLRRKRISLKQIKEQFGLMCKTGKVPRAKLRAIATRKLKNAHQFGKRLARKKARSLEPLFLETLQEFMCMNWDWLATVKNPRYRNQPGLHAWHPKAALNLMKAEGYGIQPGHDRIWYKTTRQRLKLVTTLPYSVTVLPS